MCGIFGAFARDGSALDVPRLASATNLLRHRGPDGGAYWAEGPFFFGHRRLSIIDLEARADQPFASPDLPFVLTYNGELYNYVEIKKELEALGHSFRTTSDTEVLLRAYAEWRETMLPKLRGMFAFAIADRSQKTVFLARDRFGEKPLFTAEKRGVLHFGSELRPFAAVLDERLVDDDALGAYLCLNYVPGERTMMRGVTRLPPATWRRYHLDRIEEQRWYAPGRAQVDVPEDLTGALSVLKTKLDEAVRLGLRSDVPVALFLSGGLDSSLTAESAVRAGALKDAFCVDVAARSYSEWDGARIVADKLGLALHRVTLTQDVLSDFLSLVEHADDPLADSSTLAVWHLARATAKSFKVVVSGDGGDELLGGYLTYKATRAFGATLSHVPAPARRPLAWAASMVRPSQRKVTAAYKAMRFLRAAALPAREAHFTFNGAWMPDVAATLVARPETQRAARSAITELARRHRLPEPPSLADLQRADATEYLPNDILTKVDRMTMAHSLESRAPLLDGPFADYAMAAASKFEGSMLGAPKRLFRALAHDIYGPSVAAAKKQGFSIPVHTWLREAPITRDLLSRSSLEKIPVLDTAAVEAVRDDFFAGRQLGFEIWGLLVFCAWYRARIASAPELPTSDLRRFEL